MTDKAPSILWPAPESRTAPLSNQLRIWAAPLTAPPSLLEAAFSILSADERRRARQFKFEHLQRRFIAGRAFLRAVLGESLECPPARVRFEYSATGKPFLAKPAHPQAAVEFNLAHSGELALCALTVLGPVGVDVESLRRMADAREIAGRFFAPDEIAQLKAVPPGQTLQAFFHAWTRKEAFLKATGKGITGGLDSFAVTVADRDVRFLFLPNEAGRLNDWTLWSLSPADEYVGATAIRHPSPAIESLRFDWDAHFAPH